MLAYARAAGRGGAGLSNSAGRRVPSRSLGEYASVEPVGQCTACKVRLVRYSLQDGYNL